MENLPLTQQHALHAYQGGFISLGKLAQEMGMHVIQLRQWLNERGIPQQNLLDSNESLHA